MSELITITGHREVTISNTEEARKQRDAILVLTKPLVAIRNADEAATVTSAFKHATAYIRSVEDARKAAKEPVLEQGRQIDGLAKELTLRVEAETKRIGAVLGVYQQEQQRIAEEARQAAWREEQRILREAAERERAEKEKAEAEQRELERKQLVARTKEKADEYARQAEAAALRATQAEERREQQVLQAVADTRQTAAVAVAAKPTGLATRMEVKFEVTDLVALYESAPYLVTLTPNAAAIKSALKGLTGEQKLPGVRHWKEAAVSAR